MRRKCLAETLSQMIGERVAAPIATIKDIEDCAFLSLIKLGPLSEGFRPHRSAASNCQFCHIFPVPESISTRFSTCTGDPLWSPLLGRAPSGAGSDARPYSNLKSPTNHPSFRLP